jgi:ribosomal protein S18 acetylase RimI-like enzyme
MAGYEITKANRRNQGPLLNYLRNDVARHAFALYDVIQEPENTTVFFVTGDDGATSGYLLIYQTLPYLSVILDSQKEAAEELFRLVPREKGILFVPPELLSAAKTKVSSSGIYAEEQMSLARRRADLHPSPMTRRLTSNDARAVAELYCSDKLSGSTLRDFDAARKLLGRRPFFGYEVGGKLVAIAGALAAMPEVAVIGGVFTHPEFRGRGYAKATTAAVGRYLFDISNLITLFVRSDNVSAISAYSALGFEKTGERYWVDMGTGLCP